MIICYIGATMLKSLIRRMENSIKWCSTLINRSHKVTRVVYVMQRTKLDATLCSVFLSGWLQHYTASWETLDLGRGQITYGPSGLITFIQFCLTLKIHLATLKQQMRIPLAGTISLWNHTERSQIFIPMAIQSLQHGNSEKHVGYQ